MIEYVTALLEGIIEGDLIFLAAVGVYDSGEVDVLETMLTASRVLVSPWKHPAAILSFPAFLTSATHLFIIKQRPYLFRPLVLLLRDDTFAFL